MPSPMTSFILSQEPFRGRQLNGFCLTHASGLMEDNRKFKDERKSQAKTLEGETKKSPCSWVYFLIEKLKGGRAVMAQEGQLGFPYP